MQVNDLLTSKLGKLGCYSQAGDDGDHDDALEMEIKSTR